MSGTRTTRTNPGGNPTDLRRISPGLPYEQFLPVCPLCGHARQSKAHRLANCAAKNKAKGF